MLNYSNGTLKFSGGLLNPIAGIGPVPVYTVSTTAPAGQNYCDYYSANGKVIPRNASGYFSQSMVWPVKSAVI